MGGWGRDMNLEIPGPRPQGWEEGSQTLRESHPENSHSHIALRLNGPLTTVLPLDCPHLLKCCVVWGSEGGSVPWQTWAICWSPLIISK